MPTARAAFLPGRTPPPASGRHHVCSPAPRTNANAAPSHRLRGFTLVELLITIAVLALLVRIAFPSYQAYMKRVYRSEAQSLMLDLANREQQYLLDNRSFLGGASAVSTLAPTNVPADVTAYYTVTITAAAGPPPSFLITATPKSGTPVAGETAFTLDQDGTKLPAGKWEGR
jgi:type IV pilus assembly protein PilE